MEGRADVLNLLRIDVKNTIAVQGTQIPKSIIDLAKTKNTIIAFLDGDRGGTIIQKELNQLIKIDYIARAPEGYEVEELTRKQMIKSLQNKKSVGSLEEEKESFPTEKEYSGRDANLKKFLKRTKLKHHDEIIEVIKNVPSGQGLGFSKNMEKLFEIPVGELFEKIKDYKNTQVLILDGILTKRLLSAALSMKLKLIACKNKEEDLTIPYNIVVFFF